MPPFSLSDAIVAATRPPTVGERRQLALLQIGVALDALKAGARQGLKLGYRPELDGKPCSLAQMYEVANDLRAKSGLRPINPPSESTA
jgi:hypothetical protein